ncbi:EGF_like [Seminavis robusta]|uniref:EGF_like n=1 Tax=Seminavis robusta TaxID=568900 RepID=A0A9N8H8W3_9STRA|nr:EGF_like [Seminavis robusta]|eukprot:Sro233_g094140.1 EGF_like (881) ;mRNA; r:14206-17714
MSEIEGQVATVAPRQPGQAYQYETAQVQPQQRNGYSADPQQTPAPVNYQYDAAESEALFRMVEQPKDQADAETMEYADEYGEEEEDGEVEQALTEDAYSLLYTADFFSRTAFFAITVVLLQAGMLFLTLLDLIDTNPKGEENKTNGVSNRLNVPPGATTYVTIAQFLGMVLTVMLMAVEGDIVVGFSQLLEGYDDGILHDMPNATFLRWLVTGLMQLMVGVILVLDSFILSMKSTTVIDLVLNLTALYFVQEVDEIAFQLADMGILSSGIQEDCEKVKNLKQVSPPEFIERRRFCKRVLLILLLIGLIVPYAIVVSWQTNGVYLCNHVYIQFGDAFLPEMAYYSGQFHQQGFGWADRVNDRVVYIDDSEKLKLAYCNSETAWTISWANTLSSCDYIFKSSNTDTFDVAEVDNWVVKTTTTGDVPVDWLKLVCNDCNPELCNEAYGDCKVDNSPGSRLNKCECKSKDRQGLNCELSASCLYFSLDARTTDTLAAQPGGYFLAETEFVDLRVVPGFDDGITMMHHRYIYAPLDDFEDGSPVVADNITTFMLFSGRRWVIYTLPEGSSEKLAKDEFMTFLRDNDPANRPVEMLKNISITYPHFIPLFFSSPVNYGGEEYIRESGNGWVITQPVSNYTVLPREADDNQPLPATYLCSDCSTDPDLCQNNGICDSGVCHCSYFFWGPNCERAFECREFGLIDEKSNKTGCYFEQGNCNPVTRLCEDCDHGTFGNLCQYGGPNALSDQDQLFCAQCEASYGSDDDWACNVHTKDCPCLPGYTGDLCEDDSTTKPPSDDLVEAIVNTTTEIVETILNTTTEMMGGVSNELGAFTNETANTLGVFAQPNPPAGAADGGPPQSEAPAEGALPQSNPPGDGSGNLPPPPP